MITHTPDDLAMLTEAGLPTHRPLTDDELSYLPGRRLNRLTPSGLRSTEPTPWERYIERRLAELPNMRLDDDQRAEVADLLRCGQKPANGPRIGLTNESIVRRMENIESGTAEGLRVALYQTEPTQRDIDVAQAADDAVAALDIAAEALRKVALAHKAINDAWRAMISAGCRYDTPGMVELCNADRLLSDITADDAKLPKCADAGDSEDWDAGALGDMCETVSWHVHAVNKCARAARNGGAQ